MKRSLRIPFYLLQISIPVFAQDKLTTDTGYFDSQGTIQSINYRKNGLLERSVYFDKEGVKSSELTFKKDLRDGVTTTFYNDGKVQSSCYYVHNTKHGPCEWFYKSGGKWIESHYEKIR